MDLTQLIATGILAVVTFYLVMQMAEKSEVVGYLFATAASLSGFVTMVMALSSLNKESWLFLSYIPLIVAGIFTIMTIAKYGNNKVINFRTKKKSPVRSQSGAQESTTSHIPGM